MSRKYKVVAVIGNVAAKSRTKVLVEALVEALGARAPIEVELLEIFQLAPHIGTALALDALAPVGRAAVEAIQSADLVIAASPVYKGAYSGLFKHLIDFVAPDALVGRPVLLAATGGSDRHALVVDQELRPLFSFFRAQTVPSAVYAAESDFEGYTVRSELLKARIQEAAAQAAQLLTAVPAAAALKAAA